MGRFLKALLVGVVLISFIAIAVPANAEVSITIWKPGVEVFQIDDDSSCSAIFNDDGSNIR